MYTYTYIHIHTLCIYLYLSLYMYIYICICIHIYIYIYIERERDIGDCTEETPSPRNQSDLIHFINSKCSGQAWCYVDLNTCYT